MNNSRSWERFKLLKMKLEKYSILFLLFTTFISFDGISQRERYRNSIDSTSQSRKLASFIARFGHNKKVDSAYILSFYTALSNFEGELDSTKITLKEASINTSLNARPTVGSLLFRKRENRHYVIRINNNTKSKIPLLKDADFDARVGVFGHELCHLQDYNKREFSGVMERLFAYTSRKEKSKYEKEIDSMTIWKGLGWQLFAWEKYVQESEVTTEEYKSFKRDIYYTPNEILGKIEDYELGISE